MFCPTASGAIDGGSACAHQDLNLALQHGGDDSTVYFHRGNTLLEAGKPEDAIGAAALSFRMNCR